MTFFEFQQMQVGDAILVRTRKSSKRVLRINGKRSCFVRASDGCEYELEECSPILLSDVQTLERLGFKKQLELFRSEASYCFGLMEIYSTHVSICIDAQTMERKCYAGLIYLHEAQHRYKNIHNCELKLKYDK